MGSIILQFDLEKASLISIMTQQGRKIFRPYTFPKQAVLPGRHFMSEMSNPDYEYDYRSADIVTSDL